MAYWLFPLLVGLFLSLSADLHADYVIQDHQQSAEPMAPAPDTLSFDGYIGETAVKSILQPISEEDDGSTEWSTEGSTVAVVDDLNDIQSEWSVSSPPADSPQESLDLNYWQSDWTPGNLTSSWVNDYGDFCKNCFRRGDARWTGRVDALLLWRNAPISRDLITEGGTPVFNANQLESVLAAGPRFQLFRTNSCGAAIEVGYFRAFNFLSERTVSTTTVPFRPFDIFPPPTDGPLFQNGAITLGSGIQSLELNSRTPMGSGNIQFISGFRWLEWRESFQLNTTTPTTFNNYATNCINSLYGGQLGIDSLLYSNTWLRVEGILKGGAYYNNAASHSSFQTNTGATNQNWAVNADPSSGAFVGELGFTGVLSLTQCINLRFGYTGYWLESIAQPTRQLSNPTGIVSNGNTVVQGVSLGLEGRW